MKRRVIAVVLCITMLSSILSVFASAVPYSPSATALKDFGQENIYIYEVTKGKNAPVIDGNVTDSDGYGDPVETYYMRYVANSEAVVMDSGLNPLKEYVERPDGKFYVYPTPSTSQAVWNSISSIETSSDNIHVFTNYYLCTTFNAGWANSGTYKYVHPETHDLTDAYNVTSQTVTNYSAYDKNGNKVYWYPVTTTKPDDWETDYTKYFTKYGSSYVSVVGGSAPQWQKDTYYAKEQIHVTELFVNNEGATSAAGSLSRLRAGHVILPEEVRLYYRYDGTYLYEAIQLDEYAHSDTKYTIQKRYGVNMSNNMGIMSNASSMCTIISRPHDSENYTVTYNRNVCRTYAHGLSALSEAGAAAGIIAKYGNGTTFSAAYTQDNYAIKTKPYVAPAPKVEEDEFGFGIGSSEEETVLTSGTYGTTTYELRQRWDVINSKYNPDEDKTPIPENFSMLTWIQLQTSYGNNTNFFSVGLPKNAGYLSGSNLSANGGNYSLTKYTFRYPSRVGLVGKYDGSVRFFWAGLSGTYETFAEDAFTTDYNGPKESLKYTTSHVNPIVYTCGQEIPKDYVTPEFEGTQIRTDNEKQGGMRFIINVPKTEKIIAEVGCIVAPTEAVRDKSLKYGMTSVSYNSAEFCEYYGIVDGKWINLCEDTEKYFSSIALPNDEKSYVTWDTVGGLPSGIYKVYTLKADLENPYSTAKDSNKYALEFTGLYDDFDDFFTFYTIRPFVKFADGTVSYGEHEYKSLYYVACWTIQDMLNSYNEAYSLTGANKYGMDRMPLESKKNADGETVYAAKKTLSQSESYYYNALGNSIYDLDVRLSVFRWYAIRQINRQNKVSLRVAKYSDFTESAKIAVQQYMDIYEYIYQTYILKPESRVYQK